MFLGDASNGYRRLITIKSSFGPQDTMKRLEAEVKAKGLTVFAHVDHAAGAAAVGMTCGRPISSSSATPRAARR